MTVSIGDTLSFGKTFTQEDVHQFGIYKNQHDKEVLNASSKGIIRG
ncbi:hypothetical protein [Jeotgalibacillus proteolyticus]|nr:hypothetical protein [Jeotgalibacillus proteolyticus]